MSEQPTPLHRQREALDDLDLGDLDDFESEDLDVDSAADEHEAALRGRNSYVGGLWNRYGFDSEGASTAQRIVTAHRMVQSIVNTFATDGFYRVAFDPNVSTAGTELTSRRVVITPRPLFDKTLTPQQAAVILTGMAAHEISHPRYGKGTTAAVRRVFGDKRAPKILSNLLDDVRIERRFVADYPGYADIFRPMMEYVAASSAEEVGGQITPTMGGQINLAVLAIRYPVDVVLWPTPALQAERDWWRAWADTWAREDAPRRHVEGIREALRHVLEVKTRLRAEAERAATKPREPKPPEEEPTKEAPSEDAARIAREIGALPDDVRRVMRLSAEGKRGLEIAATLDMPVRQVKRILRQTRRAMLKSRKGVRP